MSSSMMNLPKFGRVSANDAVVHQADEILLPCGVCISKPKTGWSVQELGEQGIPILCPSRRLTLDIVCKF